IEEQDITRSMCRNEFQHIKNEISMWINAKDAWLERTVSHFFQHTRDKQLQQDRFAIPGATNQEFMGQLRGAWQEHLDRIAAMQRLANRDRRQRVLTLLNSMRNLWRKEQMFDADAFDQRQVRELLRQMEQPG